jgi:hypothetical protein
MALFDAPLASEHRAEHALRASLDLFTALTSCSASPFGKRSIAS